MTHLNELSTPVVVLDLDTLESNIEKATKLTQRYGKELWPIIKTHKSMFLAKLQKKAGATGFVCGTIDEAEMLTYTNIGDTLMMAYPISDKKSFSRIAKLMKTGVRVIFRIDNKKIAELLQKHLKRRDLRAEFTVIVDVGYHRHGVRPEVVGDFVKELEQFARLGFEGVVTHPGHAYAAKNPHEVERIAREATKQMQTAVKSLEEYNITPQIIGTGSTPTFRYDVREDLYTHLFPGNYVYYDREQVALFGSAKFENCALRVLTTVLSLPQHANNTLAIIDAGSAYFDTKRSDLLDGYGRIMDHPEAQLSSLSQEIGKVVISDNSNIKIGDLLEVIPNHACFSNNSVSYIIGHRNGDIKRLIPVTVRNGRKIKQKLLHTIL